MIKKRIWILFLCVIFIILTGTVLLMLLKKTSEKNTGFSSDISPYTKSEIETYTFAIKDKVQIFSSCCDIIIKQKKSSKITVKLEKMVGDKSEENLQKELEHIVCKQDENKISIGFEDGYTSLVNSKTVKAEIIVPNGLKELEIDSNIGDITLNGIYKTTKVDMDTGDFNFSGYVNNFNINASIGEISLKIKKLDANDRFSINGNTGDVQIELPRRSKIKLTGAQSNCIKLGRKIKRSNTGAEIEINRTISDVKIK